MERHRLLNLKSLFVMGTVIATFIGGLVYNGMIGNYRPFTAIAQESEMGFRSLIVKLKSEMATNKNFLVTFYFINPIGDNLKELMVPRYDGDLPTSRLSEVGDDYFCIVDGLEGNEIGRCIPFANIASILYMNPG